MSPLKKQVMLYTLLTLLCCRSTIICANSIGECIRDPNAEALQNEWKHYFDLRKKRADINKSILVTTIRMDEETMKLLQAISETEQLIILLDKLENQFLKKAFVDTRFNEMISSPDFILKLENKQMAEEIKNSSLSFKNDPHFYDLLEQIRLQVLRTEIKEALELFRNYDLGLLEGRYRKSAKMALQLIRKKGATPEIVRSWITDPPFLKNIPLPAVKLGPFAIKYRSLLSKSIANFVLDRKINLKEARIKFPKIKQNQIEEMNNAIAPTESNSFDDYILKNSSDEITAIDGVARTLWGEATSCQQMGLAQFEAIGKIIAERSLAVNRAIDELREVTQKNTIVREKNWSTFLDNWVGIKRPAPGMQNKAYSKLKGLSDFGRKEKIQIPSAAQVISKKNQFSVWNSYSINKLHTGQFHQNIPDAIYEIQGPQAPNDDKALIRILCPEFQTQEQKNLWLHAEKIAEEIVKAPKNFIKKVQWPVSGEIFFYTHEAPLPFAKEIKADYLLVDGKKLVIRKKGKGACNNFRLFTSKIKNIY